MLSYKPAVLSGVNLNAPSSLGSLNGPFLVVADRPIDYKNVMKNAEWSVIEKARYVAFIMQNANRIEGKAYKNLWGLFQEMGNFIQTRNFRQAKSYHQKMVEKFKNISQIVCFHLVSYPQIEAYLQMQRESLKMSILSQRKSAQKIQYCKMQLPTSQTYLSKVDNTDIQNKEKEWRECHQLFLQWTNKLKNLTSLMYV